MVESRYNLSGKYIGVAVNFFQLCSMFENVYNKMLGENMSACLLYYQKRTQEKDTCLSN